MAASALQEWTGKHVRTNAPLPTPNDDGWLQESVRKLGSYAHSSNPAYGLAAMFALSTPLGFASPAQAAAEAAAKLQRQHQLAEASAAASSRGSSGLVARMVANAKAHKSAQLAAPPRAIPPFWQLAFFSAAFATGGYMIDQGDLLNGSGVITAWSLTYLFFKTAPSIRQLPSNPVALALSTGVITLGLAVHGSHYFDRTSWRGAIPALTQYDQQLQQSGVEHQSRLISFDRAGNTNNSTQTYSNPFGSAEILPNAAPNSIVNTTQVSKTRASNTDSARKKLIREIDSSSANNDAAREEAYLRRHNLQI